jgi:hypothetical protein
VYRGSNKIWSCEYSEFKSLNVQRSAALSKGGIPGRVAALPSPRTGEGGKAGFLRGATKMVTPRHNISINCGVTPHCRTCTPKRGITHAKVLFIPHRTTNTRFLGESCDKAEKLENSRNPRPNLSSGMMLPTAVCGVLRNECCTESCLVRKHARTDL